MPRSRTLARNAARGPADESTFRRAFALVSADVLALVLGAWLWTRAVQAGGRLVIAVNGKAVRGAKNKGGKAPHLVAALAHGIGAVLGQAAVDAKSDEIPLVRELLKASADLAGTVLTIDALHTQHDAAQLILGRGADYVRTVKANMPTTHLSGQPLRVDFDEPLPSCTRGPPEAVTGVPGASGPYVSDLFRKGGRDDWQRRTRGDQEVADRERTATKAGDDYEQVTFGCARGIELPQVVGA
ncbi:MAG TPA: ISAs1 family transposase [Trebonia sp.]|nr:ISAs1 family transposase [Trebonia sp.]